MFVPQTKVGLASSTSKPSPPSDDAGMSSVEVGVAGTRPPPDLCLDRDGVGVASSANRERCGGGVPNADGVEERPRRRLRRAASPGEDNVLPIGLERESSGDEGPEEVRERSESEKIERRRRRRRSRRRRRRRR